MADHELPQMAAMSYSSSVLPLGNDQWATVQALMPRRMLFQHQKQPVPQVAKKEPEVPDVPARRLVQVFIADPDPNVPLDKALLYSGEQHLTDLSDQELFFEIDVAGVLRKHNEIRVSFPDKSFKEKAVMLEPARIRDLRMTVVTIASF